MAKWSAKDQAGQEQPALGCGVDDGVATPSGCQNDERERSDPPSRDAPTEAGPGRDEGKAGEDHCCTGRNLSTGKQDERTQGYESALALLP